jgi:hypothetical protein
MPTFTVNAQSSFTVAAIPTCRADCDHSLRSARTASLRSEWTLLSRLRYCAIGNYAPRSCSGKPTRQADITQRWRVRSPFSSLVKVDYVKEITINGKVHAKTIGFRLFATATTSLINARDLALSRSRGSPWFSNANFTMLEHSSNAVFAFSMLSRFSMTL